MVLFSLLFVIFSLLISDEANKGAEDPLTVMSMASGEEYNHGNLVMKEQLSQIHHGPSHLKGKYDILGSDDEADVNAEEIIDALDEKQRKRLLKYVTGIRLLND